MQTIPKKTSVWETEMKCPRCDAPREPENAECSRCGIDFNLVEKKRVGSPRRQASEPSGAVAAPGPEAVVVEAQRLSQPVQEPPTPMEPVQFSDPSPGDIPPADDDVTCPKCEFTNPEDADECLRCGVIFDKYKAYLEKKRQIMEEVSRTTDGLIDPESLQAAVREAQDQDGDDPPEPVAVKTRCPHCSQRYRIRPDQIGITTRCKKCSSIFKIEPLPPAE